MKSAYGSPGSMAPETVRLQSTWDRSGSFDGLLRNHSAWNLAQLFEPGGRFLVMMGEGVCFGIGLGKRESKPTRPYRIRPRHRVGSSANFQELAVMTYDLGRDAIVAGIEFEFLNLASEGFGQFAVELNRDDLGDSGKHTLRGRAIRIINRAEEPFETSATRVGKQIERLGQKMVG
jgi:hypothetical protein